MDNGEVNADEIHSSIALSSMSISVQINSVSKNNNTFFIGKGKINKIIRITMSDNDTGDE